MTAIARRRIAACCVGLACALAARDVVTGPAPLHDLPLTEVPANRGNPDVFAVLISGDGGWARLDQELSAELAKRGIPVVGLDSLRYFWRARTPDGAADDVGRIIERYAAHWRRPRVLLIGYSFGADALPALFNRLASRPRARVVSLSLLGLARDYRLEVRASEWIPALARPGPPVLPELERVQGVPVLCVAGQAEHQSICPELQGRPGVEVHQIGRKHHFSYRDAELADAVLSVARVPARE